MRLIDAADGRSADGHLIGDLAPIDDGPIEVRLLEGISEAQPQLLENIGCLGWSLTAEQVAALDTASYTVQAYPIWHQRSFPMLNEKPGARLAYSGMPPTFIDGVNGEKPLYGKIPKFELPEMAGLPGTLFWSG